MEDNARSLSDIIQNVINDVQEIVRSEVRLAKTEIREEAAKAKSAGTLMSIGAAAGLFALGFILWAIVYALALVMPLWAAALVVGFGLAVVAGFALAAGSKRFKQVHAKPERTIETVKENVEWIKQHAR